MGPILPVLSILGYWAIVLGLLEVQDKSNDDSYDGIAIIKHDHSTDVLATWTPKVQNLIAQSLQKKNPHSDSFAHC